MGSASSSQQQVAAAPPSNAHSYELVYFNIRGRAETIRWLLAYGQAKYVDKRVEQADWPALKPKTLLGFLPYLVVDGKVTIGQNVTIICYLAREYGLMGGNAVQSAQVQMLVETVFELFNAGVKVGFAPDDSTRASLLKDYVDVQMPRLLKILTTYLKDGQTWLIGDKMTAADVAAAQVLGDDSSLRQQMDQVLQSYPEVSALIKRVMEVNSIKSWRQIRPVSPM